MIAVAYLVGAVLGLAIGALVTIAVLLWLAARVDEATTLPAHAGRPSADVIDLAGRRSTRAWTA